MRATPPHQKGKFYKKKSGLSDFRLHAISLDPFHSSVGTRLT